MTNIDLTGYWTGTIVYGKQYSKMAGKELYFDMELIQNGSEIAGSAIDIGGVGMSPDEAYILGNIKDIEINFIKQYSSSHFYSSKDDATKIDKSKKGPRIKYHGFYNPEDETISGQWQINLTILLLYILPIPFKNSGTWIMKRK
ncbi:MAG: hypothetical protein V4677_12670 [Bacteroidota bacterium]